VSRLSLLLDVLPDDAQRHSSGCLQPVLATGPAGL